MKAPLTRFARLGLVHHMLYARSMEDPEYHVQTLAAMARRPDIETFDCCLPYGRERQERLIPVIRACGKQHIAFAVHLFPLRKLSLSATSYVEQTQVRMLMSDLVSHAIAIGATGFVFGSGGPPNAELTPGNRAAFVDFCRWLCEQLAPHGIDALLEPFDYDFDKKFAFGPLDENLEVVQRVRADFPNIGIELDMAHLPLMREDFVSSIRRSAPFLKRVHLGNCAMRDPQDPFYGDRHPPIGYASGEIDVPELVTILRTLHEVGFLQEENRGDTIIEMNPFPGRSEDDSVADNFERVNRAWAQV